MGIGRLIGVYICVFIYAIMSSLAQAVIGGQNLSEQVVVYLLLARNARTKNVPSRGKKNNNVVNHWKRDVRRRYLYMRSKSGFKSV